ncbi:molecular chaperone GrpE [Seinonella peptonophila]|uniref:Protein GrpE n=1 Tax=Seinonella peptonophila TaxID=112248 RepID=A0A1M4V8G5_9BACL|nr:nucleotide exchange factor GrpE [Seinonella peptonophila]SHE65255.1 molecular chaperone GrpE [Seinonella peptonophila]
MSSEHQESIRRDAAPHSQRQIDEQSEVENIHNYSQSEPEMVKVEEVEESSEVEKWQAIAEEQRQKAEENHNLYLRARADIENLRRRARKDVEESLKYGVVPLIESMLPVLDNFERALEAADQSEGADVLKQGIEMVYRQFLQVLSDSGLTIIEAEGKPFDPHLHNAVQEVDDDRFESGIVVEELQSGYRYHDRVIRPSMVKVSS